MYYADALGFLGLPGQPIKIENNLKLNLVHLTAAPPWLIEGSEVVAKVIEFRAQVESCESLLLVRSKDDLRKADEKGKIAVILGLQNSSFVSCQSLKDLGVSVTGLAYQGLNALGSGWENMGVGLNETGRSFLGACKINGLIVDLSHCGHQTARDAVNFNLDVPMMASHGGCYMKYHHPRNLPDDVLKKIADRYGVVGAYLRTFGLREPEASFKDFLDHLEHMIKFYGEEQVVIGSDAYYVNVSPEEARKNFDLLKDRIDPLETQGARFPEYLATGPDLMDMIARRLDNIGALRTNLSPRVVDKILGLNFRRFLERSL